jgi:hypothetical protein
MFIRPQFFTIVLILKYWSGLARLVLAGIIRITFDLGGCEYERAYIRSTIMLIRTYKIASWQLPMSKILYAIRRTSLSGRQKMLTRTPLKRDFRIT